MKKFVIAAFALGTALAVLPATSAQAQARGILCGFTSVTDPTGEGDVQTGEIDGGPLAASEPGTGTPQPTADITLTCTIQVGATGATYAGPDAVSASASGTGAVVLPPTLVDYVAPADAPVYICTTVTVDGETYNFNYADDPETAPGPWVQDDAAACSLAISQDITEDKGLILCLDQTDPVALATCVANVLTTCGAQFLPADPAGFVDCLGLL